MTDNTAPKIVYFIFVYVVYVWGVHSSDHIGIESKEPTGGGWGRQGCLHFSSSPYCLETRSSIQPERATCYQKLTGHSVLGIQLFLEFLVLACTAIPSLFCVPEDADSGPQTFTVSTLTKPSLQHHSLCF